VNRFTGLFSSLASGPGCARNQIESGRNRASDLFSVLLVEAGEKVADV